MQRQVAELMKQTAVQRIEGVLFALLFAVAVCGRCFTPAWRLIGLGGRALLGTSHALRSGRQSGAHS